MPLPRKSIQGSSKSPGTNRKTKKKTPASRARKGERLFITCAPIVANYMMKDLAETLHGSFFADPDGRYWQVVAVRIDEQARKIYGTCQEMVEAAAFMFVPVQLESRWSEQSRP
jgi:hypothetical protein